MQGPLDSPLDGMVDGSVLLARAQSLLESADQATGQVADGLAEYIESTLRPAAQVAAECSARILDEVHKRLAKARSSAEAVGLQIEVDLAGMIAAAREIAIALGCPPVAVEDLQRLVPRVRPGRELGELPRVPADISELLNQSPVFLSGTLAEPIGVSPTAGRERKIPPPEPVPEPDPIIPIWNPPTPDPGCPTNGVPPLVNATVPNGAVMDRCGVLGGSLAHDQYVQNNPGGTYYAVGAHANWNQTTGRPHLPGDWSYLAPGQAIPCRVVPPQCWFPDRPPPPPPPDPTPTPDPIPDPPPPPPPPPDPTPCDPPPPCPEPECPPGYTLVSLWFDAEGNEIEPPSPGEGPPPGAKEFEVCQKDEPKDACENLVCEQTVFAGAFVTPPPALNWCADDVCDQVEKILAWLVNPQLQTSAGKLAKDVGTGTQTVEEISDQMADGVANFPWLKPIAKAFFSIFVGASRWATSVSIPLLGCDATKILAPWIQRQILEVVARWTGLNLDDPIQRIAYATNHECPVHIPSVHEAGMAYLAAEIDLKTWACWVKANNACPDPAMKVLKSQQRRPNLQEVLALWRRDKLGFDDSDDRMRELGVLEQGYRSEFRELTKLIPPYSDLIRMMVRDSFDHDVAERFEYDNQFGQKFQGKAKEWARAQGIEEEVMRYLWRAHWRLPSATQAFQMLHRLRPGRTKADALVSRQDVLKLLEVDDMAPFWQERMLEISYRPMRRIDVRKAYFNGSIDESECREQVLDLGYNERDADIQMQSFRQEKVEWLLGRTFTREFIMGESSMEDFETGLDYYKASPFVKGETIGRAIHRRSVEARKACAKGIKQRFLRREIDGVKAANALMSINYEPGEAADWVERWSCARASKSKEISASALCGFASKRIIGWEDMLSRLLDMGYRPLDAEAITLACKTDDDKRRSDARERELERKRKEEEKRRKEDEKAKAKEARDRRSTEQKERQRAQQQRQQAREEESAERKAERRRLQLEKAIGNCSACDATLAPTIESYLLEVIDDLTDHRGFSLDGAYAWIGEITRQACSCAEPNPQPYIEERLALLPVLDLEVRSIDNPPLPAK